jgi:hypothetical protein
LVALLQPLREAGKLGMMLWQLPLGDRRPAAAAA